MGGVDAQRAAILRTVALFDVIDMPLTSVELWRYLVSPEGFLDLDGVERAEAPLVQSGVQSVGDELFSLSRLMTLLQEDPVLVGQVAHMDGYYARRERIQLLVEKRRHGSRLAINHWRILHRWGRRFRVVPFLRLFSACNFLSLHKVHEQSDIDLYVVTRPGRLWFVRFLMNILALLRGERITDTHRAEKLCLSFNATEGEALDVLQVTKRPRDPNLSLWQVAVRSVLSRGDVLEKFIQMNARWIAPSFPHVHRIVPMLGFWHAAASPRREFVRGVLERLLSSELGDFLELQAKRIQMRHLLSQGRASGRGTDVVITDSLLKFHEKDGRDAFAKNVKRVEQEMGV